MAMMQLPRDFKDFLKLLNSNEVRYLLIGGYAVSYHGYPRATVDMDIWIASDKKNARKAIETIRDFGFDIPDLNIDLIVKEKKVLKMGVPPIRLEVLSEIDGVDFEECFKNRIIDTIEKIEVNIIDLENLKKNKKASGRMQDLADLEKLP